MTPNVIHFCVASLYFYSYMYSFAYESQARLQFNPLVVEARLEHLAVEREASASTENLATHARRCERRKTSG